MRVPRPAHRPGLRASAPATCWPSTAPGPGSPSRSSLPFEGELARAGTAYIMFNADLSRYVAHRPSILHWIFNSKAGFGEIGMGLLRAIRPWNEWIAGWGFDMAQGEPDLSDDVVLDQIRTLVGDPDLQVELVRTSLWYVNQQHATNYQVGRVFCGGDAVHRHPPSSGLGSNTSMQDAFNLAWKVAFVVKGHAGPGLLDSYTAERAPVGRADRRPGQPVPQGLRRAAGVVRPRQRRPGPRRPDQAQGSQPGGRRPPGTAV